MPVRKQHSRRRLDATYPLGYFRSCQLSYTIAIACSSAAGRARRQTPCTGSRVLAPRQPPFERRMLKRLLTLGLLLTVCATPAVAALRAGDGKLDRELRLRSATPRGHSRV